MTRLQRLSRGAIGMTALAMGMMATGAWAQETITAAPESIATDEAAPADAGDIVVTGTRIKRPDLNSNSPLTAVGAAEIRYQGATQIENVLARLPQFTADANDNVSNGSDGTANVNLRNLGSNRVLTLVNGRRMLPQQAVDVNFIPSSLVERVDVVSGGASAVYGSDALSGVVNFVMRENQDGLRIDAQTGFYQHDNGNSYIRGITAGKGYATAPSSVVDGAKSDINASFGKNFLDGRGNITIYGGYRHANPVTQDTRDVSACALDPVNTMVGGVSTATALTCGGSTNNQWGAFAPQSGPGKGLQLNNTKDGQHTWVPFTNDFLYNYAPNNYFQRSDERYTAGAFAKFKFSDAAEVYGSFMYMNDHTFSQAAPGALFYGTLFTVNCNNPFLGAGQANTLCGADAGTPTTQTTLIGYRLTVPRRDDLRHEDFRYTAGIRGEFAKGFSYDLNYLRSLVRFNETYMNNVDNVKAQRALLAVNVNGVPTCQSVIDGSDPNCRPIDVFAADGISSDGLGYIFSPSSTQSRNTQTVYSGTINGDLGEYGIRLPWTGRGIGIALGAEHRRETLVFTGDAVAIQNGTVNSDGIISVNEGYGEIEVPIISDKPFFKDLTINGGARYSSYSNKQNSTGFQSSYNVWTYKGELSWAPISDVRLRASYNRAIRAPNIAELFGAVGIGNINASDPCAGSNPTASIDVCRLTGMTDAQYGTTTQCPVNTCSQQFGGNRAVKPEIGDTYTVGVILTPRALRNFTLSVDYFNIKVDGYISSIPPSVTISQCVQSGDPFYCSLFHRSPTTGAIFGDAANPGYIVGQTINTGSLKTSGIDITSNYVLDMNSFGKLDFSLVGTYLADLSTEPLPGLGSYDCKGLYGGTCGQPTPKWRHQLRTTWQVPGANHANLSLNWRYFGAVDLATLSDNEFLTGAQSIINRKIGAYSYFDLAASVDFNDRFTLRAGANNLLDKDPPAIAQGLLQVFGNGNTYPGVYDPLGRQIFVGATVKF